MYFNKHDLRLFNRMNLWFLRHMRKLNYFKFRKDPVPFTGIHSNVQSCWRWTPSSHGTHRMKAINCDEDHASFVRHHTKERKEWRSDNRSRTWKNRKLRHQWEVHIKK